MEGGGGQGGLGLVDGGGQSCKLYIPKPSASTSSRKPHYSQGMGQIELCQKALGREGYQCRREQLNSLRWYCAVIM